MKNQPLSLILFLCIATSAMSQVRKSVATTAKADSMLLAGDAKGAREIYRKVVMDTMKNAGVWSRFALSNLSLKDYNEAIRLGTKALSLHPAAPVKMNTYAVLARSYSAAGQIEKALTSLDSAARIGYVNVKLVDSHEDLNNVRKDPRFKTVRDKIYINMNPCMADAKAREFDFWLGEWDVYVTGTKTYAGHSRIDLSSGGCALLENWDSNASTGKSLNFIDPLSGKWRQTWVGSYANGTQDFVNGEYKDGAMRFVYEVVTPQGRKDIGRFIFYNQKPGQVRQFNETSPDGGKTWVTTYDFTYFKKASTDQPKSN